MRADRNNKSTVIPLFGKTSTKTANLLFFLTSMLVLAFLSTQATAQSSLKKCPSSQSQRYDNCYGLYNFPEGGSYEGEWQDDKRNGRGTYKYKNGQILR